MEKPVYVTQPCLPSFDEFVEELKVLWENKRLTNFGRFHQELENALCDFLGVKYVSLFANGTLALITALKVSDLTGEVITTPLSFVATTHAIWWNGLKPIFADIEHDYLTLNPEHVKASITSETSAILPVHVFGNPCLIEELEKIANTYGLALIYDAAHAFGVKVNGNSILNFGDLSVLSFHATKVFNTIEGGAIICHDEKTKEKIDRFKNFGYADEINVESLGINAKLNELQAIFGLLNLRSIDEMIKKRYQITMEYRNRLKSIAGISYINDLPNVLHNYAYFPILVDQNIYGISVSELFNKLKKKGIFSRRYFYPLINHFPLYKELPSAKPQNLPIAESIADQILCLPIYPTLELSTVEDICNIVSKPYDN